VDAQLSGVGAAREGRESYFRMTEKMVRLGLGCSLIAQPAAYQALVYGPGVRAKLILYKTCMLRSANLVQVGDFFSTLRKCILSC
jgi:hypothetical protein